jgi:PilZ domain
VTLVFHPMALQVALIEPEVHGQVDHDAGHRLMGVVANSEGPLIILGVSASQLADGSEVMVSIFTPEGLYRMRATSHWDGTGRLMVDPIHATERVQRRNWPRHPLHLDVTLAPLDGDSGDVTGVTGQTLDLSVGGLRVATNRCLPPGADLTVMLTLPDGIRLVARTTVVYAYLKDDIFEYRLAFDQLDEIDLTRLTALVGGGTSSD